MGVKKSMLGLFERSQLGRTKAFYRMSKLICVQKLSQFEDWNFGKISCKGKKLTFYYILYKMYRHLQFLSKLAEICTWYTKNGLDLGIFRAKLASNHQFSKFSTKP